MHANIYLRISKISKSFESMDAKKYKLGLALSGGGAKGFAHCGALLALEEFGLRPEVIAGTSAGAIVGALYAAGNSPLAISKMFMGKEFTNFVKFLIPKSGFFDHSPFGEFISENLHVSTFEELQIPMHVVASDLDNGVSKVFSSGNLRESIMASCSLPVIFNPVVIGGIHYVDGGIFRNFPVTPIRDLCDQVIGINVSPLISDEYKQSIISIAMRAYHFMFRANALEDEALCDYMVEVKDTSQYSTFDLDNINDIFLHGYHSTVAVLENTYGLKRLLESQIYLLPESEPVEKKRRWSISFIGDKA